MNELEFFDCNCSGGARHVIDPGSFHTFDDLVRKMNHYGIEKALVYHSIAREHDPMTGNEMLMREIVNYPCLVPVWVVLHHHTEEFPEPGQLKNMMKEQNVKAVALFSSAAEQNFTLHAWNCGELFTMLQTHKVPVFISLDQLSWNELHTLCTEFPSLRVVLTGAHYRIDRNILALFKIHPELRIETIAYKVNDGIEEVCRRFGAKRLLFGSNMPVHSGGSAATMIRYAEISDEEKRLIAGENLKHILEEVSL